MKDSVRNYWVEFNEPLEGRVPFMYCDKRGWVSTGVGNLIDATAHPMTAPNDAERSASLAMANEFNWTAADNSSADSSQVAADWDAVKSHLSMAPQGYAVFKQFTQLTVSNDDINRMIGVKVDQMETFLKSRSAFGGFDDWPADAQLAVLSMAWGMGPAFGGFPLFEAAVSQSDWATAAIQCHFQPDQGTIKVRNLLDAQSFRNAGRVVSDGLDPDKLVIDLTNVLGVQIALQHYGYKLGLTDGVSGPSTQAAVNKYQADNNLTQTGDTADVAAQLAQSLTDDGFIALTS